MLDEKRYNRQHLGVEKWGTNKGIGTLDWFPGVGKTMGAIIALKRAYNKRAYLTTTILLPSEALINQWTKILKEVIPEIFPNISFRSINECVLNNVFIDTDFLIIDEFHEFYTDERGKYITKERSKYKFLLCLTGTRKDKDKKYLFYEQFAPVVDIITEKEALQNNFIASSIEYNYGVYLTDDEQLLYNKYSDEIKNLLPKFGSIEMAVMCFAGKKATKTTVSEPPFKFCNILAYQNNWRNDLNINISNEKEINDNWNPKTLFGQAQYVMKCIGERKRIYQNAINKIEIGLEIVEKFKDLKYITFCQSTAMADTFYDEINQRMGVGNCMIYHSNIKTQIHHNGEKEIKFGKTKLKSLAIENIKSGKARGISTSSALDKGFDVQDISLLIIFSGSHNPVQNTQRTNRGTRIDMLNPDKVAIIVNMYAIGTADADSLRSRQKNNNKKAYDVRSVEEIDYTPKNVKSNITSKLIIGPI